MVSYDRHSILRFLLLASILCLALTLGTTAIAQEDAHHDDDEKHDAEQIVITGTPIEHDRDELAVPVDRIDRDELLDKLGATLGETLRNEPGIAASGFTGGASRPVIRGQDAFRTEVLEDGLPTQDVSRESQDHAIPVNPLAFDRIEIVRGPATLRYGGGASAGAINMISSRVPDTLLDRPASGRAYGAIDTVQARRDIALALDGALGNFAWHLDGMLRDTKDYEIPTGGRQRGTFSDSFSVSAGGSYFIGDKGRVGVAYTRAENEYGIPEEDEDARIDMRTDRVRGEADWFDPIPGIREVRVRGVWSDYRHDEIAAGVVGQTYRNEQFDGRLEALHDPVLGFIGAFGLVGTYRDFRALGEAAEFLAPTHTTTVAGYVFEERELIPGLVGEFGLRIEGTEVEGTPVGGTFMVSRNFVPISGSLGLVAEPCEWLTIGLLGAASQRAPAAVELFARGPHEATGTFEIGDVSLDEETSYTGEIRFSSEGDRYRAEAAAFVTYYEDYIFGQLTGATVDEDGLPSMDPDALDELMYLSRNALFAGFEAKARVDLLYAFEGAFGIDGQMDYVRAKFSSGLERDVPRITPMRWGSGLFFERDCFRTRVGFLRTEAQSKVFTDETPTGSFTFLNASANLRLTPFGEAVPIELSVVGENLTDERARNHVSFNAQDLLLRGRNVRVGVRVSF